MIKSKEIVSIGIDARARVPLEYLPLATVFVCLFVCLFFLCGLLQEIIICCWLLKK